MDIGLFGVSMMCSAATAVLILAVVRAEMMYIDYQSRGRGAVNARHGDTYVYDSGGHAVLVQLVYVLLCFYRTYITYSFYSSPSSFLPLVAV